MTKSETATVNDSVSQPFLWCCRGKSLTNEMSAALARLELRNVALVDACVAFGDRHSSHLSPERM